MYVWYKMAIIAVDWNGLNGSIRKNGWMDWNSSIDLNGWNGSIAWNGWMCLMVLD